MGLFVLSLELCLYIMVRLIMTVCLALHESVSVERPLLKYMFFYILSSLGVGGVSFPEIASRFKQRFGKGTLQAVSQAELNRMTQKEKEFRKVG